MIKSENSQDHRQKMHPFGDEGAKTCIVLAEQWGSPFALAVSGTMAKSLQYCTVIGSLQFKLPRYQHLLIKAETALVLFFKKIN